MPLRKRDRGPGPLKIGFPCCIYRSLLGTLFRSRHWSRHCLIVNSVTCYNTHRYIPVRVLTAAASELGALTRHATRVGIVGVSATTVDRNHLLGLRLGLRLRLWLRLRLRLGLRFGLRLGVVLFFGTAAELRVASGAAIRCA